ncbi:hypothetical protein ABZ154_15795 [Streptomyces sp. NPDC006261]|uniref:hypothetical protein n=1 Tax=Streptomyces sp. NPDC006261 TaxID=3156739 RepID=UPI0033BA5BF8
MASSMNRIRQETIEQLGPEPTTLAERLAHTLAAHADTDGGWLVAEATSNIYGSGVRTGITLDDLRAIQKQLATAEARIGNVLALCDEAERQGIVSGGGFRVSIVRAVANAAIEQ